MVSSEVEHLEPDVPTGRQVTDSFIWKRITSKSKKRLGLEL